MIDSGDLFVRYREYENGGNVQLMKGLKNSNHDYKDLLVIAECFASLGRQVKTRAPVHYKDSIYHVVYKHLIGTRY